MSRNKTTLSQPSSLYFLFVFLIFLKFAIPSETKTHWNDILVLKDFKNGIDPKSIAPGSCLSSWDFTKDPCDSLLSDKFTCGVRCDRVISGLFRVTEITLDQAGYYGTLNSTPWNLPYIETLDISDNFFSGSVPDTLSNLTSLLRLGLSGNLFSGSIPTSLGSLSSLEELYLDENYLEGDIPSSLNDLTSLKRLELQGNKLSGEFPNLGSLKNLYYLDTSDNIISGEFPSSLPDSLVELTLRNNTFHGNLKESINNLKFLQVLDLSYNQLSGPILSSMFRHPSLEQVTLSHNKFKFFQVPSDKGVNSNMIAIDFSHNELGRLLPSFFASMPKLSALNLEHNKFTGMIPSQYALRTALPGEKTASSFERLLLGGNYLFGPIPGPFIRLKPGSANVSLVDNCLFRCPDIFFFCRGADQKSLGDCRSFGPVIP